MAKRKEIKFQERYGGLLGRRNGMLFMIETEQGLPDTCAKSHWVSVAMGREEKGEYVFSTAGYQYFHLDEAKEFCRQIGDGEISLKELWTRYAAEDAAKEQAAIREVTERAKKFHARLDAMGLKYRDLLELEVLAHSLGDMGHNILLGYERGEGWPSGT